MPEKLSLNTLAHVSYNAKDALKKAIIQPEHRVATAKYFEVLTQNEQIASMKTNSLARSRFDKKVEIGEAGSPVRGGKKMAGNRLPVKVDLDNESPAKAIKKLELPPQTLYLIDKVVRAKALYGPIGVDNSEVINIEMERELRRRNRYIASLYGEKAIENEGDSEGEFDEDGLKPEERENLENEKLLQRLYKAAQAEISDVARE